VPSLIFIDSGTTNTRVRMWDGHTVTASVTKGVGARDTAMDGHSGKVEGALTEMVAQVQLEAAVEAEAILCSGMITSNVGLVEVAHLPAPVGQLEISSGVVRRDFPHISSLPFFFVPGVKSVPETMTPETIVDADIMRGEEVEVIGLLELLHLKGPVVFLHIGSHHKSVLVNAHGTIERSRTSITGEFYATISQNTVLKNSVVPELDSQMLDSNMWRLGFRHVQTEGIGRALFLARVSAQLWDKTKVEVTSYLLGAAAALDIPLLTDAHALKAQIVIYGQEIFSTMLSEYLREELKISPIVVDKETSELSSAVGSARIFSNLKSRNLC